jgi:small subunit ribosomal protein S17
MTATQKEVQAPAAAGARRNEKVGHVVSTKMQKTIVVAVEMRKPHAKYKRPLSKLKRWSLEEIVRRSSLGQIEDAVLPGETVAAEK